jgi:hypothetical protein
MSRYNLQLVQAADGLPVGKAGIAYGHDRFMGFFLQILDEDGEVALDRDAFNGMTGPRLSRILEVFRNRGDDIPARHVVAARNNVPF